MQSRTYIPSCAEFRISVSVLAGRVRSRSRSPPFVPSPVRDAIRVAILRRASFSLRSNFRPPCLACASRLVHRMALKSSHSARHGPQPARFLTQNGSLLHVSFATSGSCFHKKPRLRINAEYSRSYLASLKKGLIFSREARKCAGEDKAYLRFMRRK